MPNANDVARTNRAVALMRARGLTVHYVDGWQNRGRSTTFNPQAVIEHHDASSIKSGNAGALSVIINGRPGIPGPLSQWQVGRDGTWFVVAAGTANHAGTGGFRGLTGNSQVWGVEVANDGVGEPYSSQLHQSLNIGLQVLLEVLGKANTWLCGHKEWAPKRKTDPRHSMDWRRSSLSGASATTTPIIGRGDTGPYVEEIQRILGLPVDGKFGPQTQEAVMNYQRDKGFMPDGLVGPVTWAALRGRPFWPQGDIEKKYLELGGDKGFLGKPLTNENTCPDGVGKYTHFDNGSIYWYPEIGAHEVHGNIKNAWVSLGWEAGILGYPTSDEEEVEGGNISYFENGTIRWSVAESAIFLTAKID